MTNKKNVKKEFQLFLFKELSYNLGCRCIRCWMLILLINLENDEFGGIWFLSDQFGKIGRMEF